MMRARGTRSHSRLRLGRGPRNGEDGEDGYVIVVVIVIMAIGLLIGAAALAETLASRSHANLDARQRRALQAADAGVQAVLYHENQLDLGSLDLTGGSGILGTLVDCLVPNLSVSVGLQAGALVSASAATGTACPVGVKNGANVPYSTTIPIGNHDSYNAEFYPSATTPNATSGIQFIGGKIISIGVDDNGNPNDPQRYVYEKVQASLAPIDPFRTVEANHDLTFNLPLATVFNGTARAGDKLFFNAGLLGAFVGSNLLGSGGNIIGPTSIDVGCQGSSGAYTNTGSPLVVPVVLGGMNVANPQTCSPAFWFNRAPISVSNSPLKPACPTGIACSSLTGYTGGNQDEIYITNGAQLNLAPGDYVFCSLQTNGPINVTASGSSAPVRIFIDSPTSPRCASFASHSARSGYQTGAGSFVALQGVGGLVGGLTSTLTPSQIQIYDVGNGTGDGTTVTSSGSVANAFFLYAPNSNVSVSSTVSFAGTVIGYDVTMQTLVYTQDLGLNNYPLSSTLGIFHIAQYAQCPVPTSLLTGTVATDASGC
jgi:hypothetical protein